MTIEQLRKMRDAVPFQPFKIHLAGSRTLSVPHRDFLSVGPAGRVVMFYGPGDAWSAVDAFLISEVEVQPTPTTANGETGSTSSSS
jgi:hypothetical protein